MTASGGGGERDASAGRHADTRTAADLYETLQVSPNANHQVIRAAYRVLARDYHPDANIANVSVESQRRIRELNVAYQVLNDPQRRAEYDLERLRTHRHERGSRFERGGLPSMVEAGRVRRLPDQVVGETRVDEHFPALRTGAIIILTLVVVLAMLAILLLWSAVDAGRDEIPAAYHALPAVQLAQR